MIEGEYPDSLKLLLRESSSIHISRGRPPGSQDPKDASRNGYRLFDLDRNIFIDQ